VIKIEADAKKAEQETVEIEGDARAHQAPLEGSESPPTSVLEDDLSVPKSNSVSKADLVIKEEKKYIASIQNGKEGAISVIKIEADAKKAEQETVEIEGDARAHKAPLKGSESPPTSVLEDDLFVPKSNSVSKADLVIKEEKKDIASIQDEKEVAGDTKKILEPLKNDLIVVSNGVIDEPDVILKNAVSQEVLQVVENVQEPVKGLLDTLEEDSAIERGKEGRKEENFVQGAALTVKEATSPTAKVREVDVAVREEENAITPTASPPTKDDIPTSRAPPKLTTVKDEEIKTDSIRTKEIFMEDDEKEISSAPVEKCSKTKADASAIVVEKYIADKCSQGSTSPTKEVTSPTAKAREVDVAVREEENAITPTVSPITNNDTSRAQPKLTTVKDEEMKTDSIRTKEIFVEDDKKKISYAPAEECSETEANASAVVVGKDVADKCSQGPTSPTKEVSSPTAEVMREIDVSIMEEENATTTSVSPFKKAQPKFTTAKDEEIVTDYVCSCNII